MMRVLLAACAAPLVAVALVAVGAPAAAHEGDGELTVEAAHAVGPLGRHYVVVLTYVDDGHEVPEATVTAVAEGPAGAAVAPVPLTSRGDGRYEGVVTFPEPGAWTVRFTSVTPPATLERPEEVEGPPPTATATSPTSVPDAAAPRPVDDPGGDGAPLGLVVAAVVLLAIAAAAAALKTRFWRT